MEISASPEEVKRRIKVIRAIHYTILGLFFICLGLVIFSPELGLYGAFAISSMGVVQARNRGDCPLTIEERNARKQIGETVHGQFIEGVFKKHFNIHVSRYVINVVLTIGFMLSGYVVLSYLIDAMRLI